MNRAEKEQEILDLRKRFEASELVIITQNKGLTDKQSKELRSSLRAEGGSYKIAKNTLAKLALKGTKYEGLADKFTGPTGIATSKDPMVAARVTYNFAKTNDKLVIVGGASDTALLDTAKINYLATLPSLDQLRGKLVGLLQAPGAQLARLTNAYATKDQA
ncbi:MAG: 50S ribosomal protein L10 [Micavibrio sp.]